MAAQPWERQDGENDAPYAAFVAYRDLGPARSVLAAYRQRTGKKAAKQASGEWNKWAKKFRWADRAVRYDSHLSSVAVRATEKVVASAAVDWEQRKRAGYEADFALAERLTRQADLLAQMPVVRRTVSDGERTTIVEPITPAALRSASIVAVRAAELRRAAINDALGTIPTQKIINEHQGEVGGTAGSIVVKVLRGVSTDDL